MMKFFGRIARAGAVLSEGKNPWGGGGGGDEGGDGPKSPWGMPRRPGRGGRAGEVTSLDDFLKKSRDRFGGRFPPSGQGRPYWAYGLAAFVVLWLIFTSMHRIGPQERGVVTTFGRYERTLGPGIGFSWPAPIGAVQTIDVEQIRTITIPDGTAENLILTGDQNVIDLAYSVRWNIKDPQLYLFQIADPDGTIREVAESAMRAAVARVSLEDAIGSGRGDIEQRVEQNMQQLLDDYGAGVAIQGIAINQSVPPAAVNEAFLNVTAAQQRAQTAMNNARAYALQLTAKAQGDAATFDKVYVQYRAAPEVTRRRMYYETMERVLARVDTVIVEAPGVTPYLPLTELQRRAAPAQAAPAQPVEGAAR